MIIIQPTFCPSTQKQQRNQTLGDVVSSRTNQHHQRVGISALETEYLNDDKILSHITVLYPNNTEMIRCLPKWLV